MTQSPIPTLALRLTQGIEIRDQPIALPMLEEAIETKEFLSLPHTAKWFREEAYIPDKVIDRATLGEWEELGSQDAAMRASARVEELLANHTPEPLPDDVRAELLEIMMAEARALGKDELPVFGRGEPATVGA